MIVREGQKQTQSSKEPHTCTHWDRWGRRTQKHGGIETEGKRKVEAGGEDREAKDSEEKTQIAPAVRRVFSGGHLSELGVAESLHLLSPAL